jgi:hypothetical protein
MHCTLLKPSWSLRPQAQVLPNLRGMRRRELVAVGMRLEKRNVPPLRRPPTQSTNLYLDGTMELDAVSDI